MIVYKQEQKFIFIKMVCFTTIIKKFAEKGEKTGWTYIDISAHTAQQLIPGNKKSFRVKGKLDEYIIEGVSLVPMGGGDFILPVNATVRKNIKKRKGDKLRVQLEVDTRPVLPSEELIECLKDEPAAFNHFYRLPKSHQNYFTRWIESAKTIQTKSKRIALTVNSLSTGKSFSEMFRAMKERKDALG
ncbi:MAG TPA: YdeI/OmpD-associated family protein [Chitinophagaceae bacterium]|nr:YdeI/OmpD-associated family protein [Chitinophagaceae bacterium]